MAPHHTFRIDIPHLFTYAYIFWLCSNCGRIQRLTLTAPLPSLPRPRRLNAVAGNRVCSAATRLCRYRWMPSIFMMCGRHYWHPALRVIRWRYKVAFAFSSAGIELGICLYALIYKYGTHATRTCLNIYYIYRYVHSKNNFRQPSANNNFQKLNFPFFHFLFYFATTKAWANTIHLKILQHAVKYFALSKRADRRAFAPP